MPRPNIFLLPVIFAFFIQGILIPAFGQNYPILDGCSYRDSTNDRLHCPEPNYGAYRTFEEFVNNAPSIQGKLTLDIRGTENSPNYDEILISDEFGELLDIWGYADETGIYWYNSKDRIFNAFIHRGTLCYAQDRDHRLITVSTMDVTIVNWEVKMQWCVIDIRTGEKGVVKSDVITRIAVRSAFSDDQELLQEYNADKNRKVKIEPYVLRYNRRNSVIPKLKEEEQVAASITPEGQGEWDFVPDSNRLSIAPLSVLSKIRVQYERLSKNPQVSWGVTGAWYYGFYPGFQASSFLRYYLPKRPFGPYVQARAIVASHVEGEADFPDISYAPSRAEQQVGLGASIGVHLRAGNKTGIRFFNFAVGFKYLYPGTAPASTKELSPEDFFWYSTGPGSFFDGNIGLGIAF